MSTNSGCAPGADSGRKTTHSDTSESEKTHIFPCFRGRRGEQEVPGSSPGATIFSRQASPQKSRRKTFSAGVGNPYPVRISDATDPGDRAGSGFQRLEERLGSSV